MKKLSVITLIALALCLVMVFTACSSGSGVGGLFGAKSKNVFDSSTYVAESETIFSSAQQLFAFDGYTLTNYGAGFYLFSKTNESGYTNKIVFNAFTETNVVSVTENDNVHYSFNFNSNNYVEAPYYVMTTITYNEFTTSYKYKYDLCNAGGSTVASFERDSEYTGPFVVSRRDLMVFDGNVYRIGKDGSINTVKQGNELADYTGIVNNIDEKCNGNYYASGEKNISVYNTNLELVYFNQAPSYASEVEYFILNSGDIVLQYLVEKFDTDKDYDIIKNNTKYDLTLELINIEKGKASSLSSSYYYAYIFGRYEEEDFEGISAKVENIGYGYPIVDKRVDQSEASVKMFTVSNKGKVENIINETIDGETGFNVISADRIRIYTATGQTYLCDYEGNVIGELSNYERMTKSYIIGNKAIYNYNLNKVCDYAADGYAYEGTMGDGIVLSKENSDGSTIYNLYRAGNMMAMCTENEYNSLQTRGNAYYVVRSYSNVTGNNSYTLYNAAGTQVFTSQRAINVRTDSVGDKKCYIAGTSFQNPTTFATVNQYYILK